MDSGRRVCGRSMEWASLPTSREEREIWGAPRWPSLVGGASPEPPGNGKVAPVESLTLWLLATAVSGAPTPLSETAPIQLHEFPWAEARSVSSKLIAVS